MVLAKEAFFIKISQCKLLGSWRIREVLYGSFLEKRNGISLGVAFSKDVVSVVQILKSHI